MTIGTWYYPKTWPRDRWSTDADRMVEAGFEQVRIGVFHWSRIEPRPGDLDFEWLESAVDLFGDRGIDVVLGTPTGAPPKWLIDRHPGMVKEGPDGTTYGFGGRRHYCFNSAAYRRECDRIVGEQADRFADHPAVIGWQVDNELGGSRQTRCYCDHCAAEFRTWLREKYGDVETLNERWGTEFWSQRYDAFAEIEPPRTANASHHPSRVIDFRRFTSDSVRSFVSLQVDRIREANADWFVTTNRQDDFSAFDEHDLAEPFDLVTWDSYPTIQTLQQPDVDAEVDGPTDAAYRAGDPVVIGMNHDLYRGVLDRPFWVMEQQAGDHVGVPWSPEPADGAVRLWAHQAVAHGAAAVNYFRWRTCPEGQEQYWGGLLHHHGGEDRGLPEAERAADELDGLPELDAPDASVAVLHDYDNLWGVDIQSNASGFHYWAHLRTYYRALRARGVTVDVRPPTADLDRYDLAVAPTLHLVDDALADHLAGFVDGGGRLVLTIRSGVKNPYNHLVDGPFPGPLADLAGTTVDQHESVPDALDKRITYDGTAYDYRTWAEWLAPDAATVAGEHASGPAAGRPAVTRHDRGGGVTYVGVWPEPPLASAIVGDELDAAGVDGADPLPSRIDVSERDGHTWVANFRDEPIRVAGGDDWVVGDATIGPVDLGVVRSPAASLSVSAD